MRSNSERASRPQVRWRAAAATLVTAAAMAIPASGASAITFDSFNASYDDIDGQPQRQAGAHPDVRIKFTVPAAPDDSWGNPGPPEEQFHRVKVDMPPGLIGNPTAVEQCVEVKLASVANGNAAGCPTGSQVGFAIIKGLGSAPVYNVVPPGGTPGMFAFNVFGVIVKMIPKVQAGSYAITIDTGTLSSASPLQDSDITLWGVPADPVHDGQRYDANQIFPTPPTSSQSPRVPFLSLATSCPGTAETITGHIDGWRSIGQWDVRSITRDFNDVPLTLTGCEALPFDPSIAVRTATKRPNAPSGVDVDLIVPQNASPDALTTAHVKDVTVALPDGLTISPSAANGLTACTDAQLALASNDREQCPRSSKIGSVTVKTALLSEPLTGSVYVGSQESNDPASGKMFRTFIVASSDASGVRIKLEGAVRPDTTTGRLTATFANNPQLPFDELNVKFDGGPGAVLATPESCGPKTTDTQISSWSGKTVTPGATFAIDCLPGLGAFGPSFSAGSVSPMAAASSPFALAIEKPDLQSALTGVRMALPKGLLANLKGNVGQQVGSVTALAGPGSTPFRLPGRVYLEGAYGDAPFSLKVVVPAKAGPFDLGEVVVRQKLYVDPGDAHVTVVSDPLPTIVKGVPVRLQRLDVSVDKPGFMVNPTSCEEQTVSGTLGSATGQTAPVNVRFQVGGCADLKYAPKLGLKVHGELKNGGHPQLDATLTTKPGEANQRKAQVTLPLNLALDPKNAKALCEPSQVPSNSCPAESIVGKATAVSILDVPLEGPVYFVRGERTTATGRKAATLPRLFIPLSGQGVTVNLHASSYVVDRKLQTTFDNLPDAPIERFELQINGGANGILEVTNGSICRSMSTPKVGQRMTGHNGKVHRASSVLGTACKTAIVKASRSGVHLKVTVGGQPEKRTKVTASGKGLVKASRTISARSTVATVRPLLSTGSRRALAAGRTLRLKVTATVKPTAKGSKAKKVSKTIVVKPTRK